MKNGEQKDIGCNGKGKRTILVKVKKFREPAKMYVMCRCAKCQSHLTNSPLWLFKWQMEKQND
jgi:hypothetical protein